MNESLMHSRDVRLPVWLVNNLPAGLRELLHAGIKFDNGWIPWR